MIKVGSCENTLLWHQEATHVNVCYFSFAWHLLCWALSKLTPSHSRRTSHALSNFLTQQTSSRNVHEACLSACQITLANTGRDTVLEVVVW